MMFSARGSIFCHAPLFGLLKYISGVLSANIRLFWAGLMVIGSSDVIPWLSERSFGGYA
jgi:hypothetical protein